MDDVMVDLETLGTQAGCVVLSIGAVRFSAEGLGEEFYTVVSRQDSEACGLNTDPGTLKWWKDQSEAARTVLYKASSDDAPTLKEALQAFSRYVGTGARIWGNGAGFDNPILAALYKTTKTRMPYKFWDERCYRTLKAMYPEVGEGVRGGVYHNALDDARHQAQHAVRCLKLHSMRGGVS